MRMNLRNLPNIEIANWIAEQRQLKQKIWQRRTTYIIMHMIKKADLQILDPGAPNCSLGFKVAIDNEIDSGACGKKKTKPGGVDGGWTDKCLNRWHKQSREQRVSTNYLEDLPSTREKREWWKQQNTHQPRWVTLIIRLGIQGRRNSEVHLMLEYIGRNIRVNSGSRKRRPTSLIVRYCQIADTVMKRRLKQYSM